MGARPAMRRIRLVLEYDGANYVGWQLQQNGVSVQQRLNEAIFSITGEPVQAHGSGRTDSGVHARAQVAHFDTNARMPAEKFAFALNAHLPRDIRVRYSDEVPGDFHARFSVEKKSYRYTVQTGAHPRVITRDTALHVHVPLDLARMRQSAADVLGEHDFAAFCSAGACVERTVRTLFRSEWTADGAYLYYDVTANGFLYNMVRILVGTMLDIACGRLEPSALLRALNGGARSDLGATAPARGLALTRVEYADFNTDEVLTR